MEKTQEHLENLEIHWEHPWLTSEIVSKITPHSKHRQRVLQVQQATKWQSPSSARASGDQRSEIICRVKKPL